MTRQTALKLSIGYLITLMAISIGFSTVLYRVYSNELNRGLHRQGTYFLQFQPITEFDDLRQQQLDEGLGHLRGNLIIFNLAILVIGGVASYGLARRTLRPIEQAIEAQNRFTADASHELRTPLTAMQTEIEVALRNPTLDKKETKELLKSNLEELAKLKQLSEGLLRLSGSNGHQILVEPVELAEVIKDALDRVILAASHKQIKITTKLKSVRTKGDQANLTDLVAILLDNAIKYSPEKTTISLKLHRDTHHALVEIRDQGFGIKATDLPHIFERFYRADPSRSKEKTEGYGLGLSIAKKIANVHRGSISVVSYLGKGSIFTVTLPLAKA